MIKVYEKNVREYIQNCSEESTNFLEKEFTKLGMECGYQKRKRFLTKEHKQKIGSGNWRGGKRVAQRRGDAKRNGNGFIPINEIFEGAHSHHIDRDFVIYIPAKLHRSIYHRLSTGKNMKEMNEAAFAYTYKEDRKDFDTPIYQEKK